MNSTMKLRQSPGQDWPVRCVVCALDPLGDAAAEEADAFLSGLKAALAGAGVEWAADLEAAFQSESDDRVLVLSRAPVISLAAALAGNGDPETAAAAAPDAALAHWIGTREAMLARVARARRRVTILDVGLFARRDAEAWALVCLRLGIDAAPPLPEIAAPADPQVAPVHEIAAAALIRRDPRAARIAEALQVATIGAEAGEPSVAPVFALLGDWREAETRLALLAENIQTQMRATTDRLEAQLRTDVLRQATIEALEYRLATQEAAAQRERAVLGATLQESASASRAAEAERETLVTRLAGLEADRNDLAAALAEATGRLAAIGAAMKAEEHARAAVQAELATLHLARKQAESDAADRDGKLALLRENVALQAQSNDALAARNAELGVTVDRQKEQLRNQEALQATNKALENRLATQEATASHDRAILGAALLEDARTTRALEARLAALGAMIDDAQRSKAELRSDLDRVFTSKSWQLTAPLRALRRRLGPKPRD